MQRDGTPRIRLILADDHPIFRDAVRRSLEAAGGFAVVAEAATVPSLLAQLRRTYADVVLLDLRLPGGGLAAIDALRAAHPDGPKVVVLSATDEPKTIHAALERGASAYVVKSIGRPDLAFALRQCVRPTLFVPARAAADEQLALLSASEREILDDLARGLSTKEIAASRWLSRRTVQFHLGNVYRKLGVRNRVEAVRVALAATRPPATAGAPPSDPG